MSASCSSTVIVSNEHRAKQSSADLITVELRQLTHFVTVAEEGSFTRAAARLGYVQSALSVSIQSLERELEVRLLDRSTHRVGLSDAGRVLLPYARATLAAAEELRDQTAAVRGVLRGTLRVGIMQSFMFLDLPRLFGEFRRAHPAVELVMRPSPGGSAALLEGLRAGDFDVAFAGVGEVRRGLTTVPLASEELFLVSARPSGEGSVRLADLTEWDLVDFPSGWGVRSAIDTAFADARLTRRITIEVADVTSCLALVREGVAASILPPSLISAAGGELSVRPIRPRVQWHVVMATPSDRPATAAAAAFLELVEAERAAERDP
jgi:DNA-binding transcriptional LysR family regulator